MSDNQNVKKVYLPLLNLLQSNQSKVVSTLLPQILNIMQNPEKRGGHAFYDLVTGNLVGVLCYYHKKYELVGDSKSEGECDYGLKLNTPSGVNTMCKIGATAYSSRNNAYKTGREKIMLGMMSIPPTISLDEARPLLNSLENSKNAKTNRSDGLGFATVEDMINFYGSPLTSTKPASNSSDDNTISSDDNTISSDDNTISSDDNTISSDDNTKPVPVPKSKK